jgi:hypothetical protein
MPRTRLNNVAAAIAPDDFNICDIAGFSRKVAKSQSQIASLLCAFA